LSSGGALRQRAGGAGVDVAVAAVLAGPVGRVVVERPAGPGDRAHAALAQERGDAAGVDAVAGPRLGAGHDGRPARQALTAAAAARIAVAAGGLVGVEAIERPAHLVDQVEAVLRALRDAEL